MAEGTTHGLGIGDALRAAREEKGLTVQEIARSTKVRSDYLVALEDEQFARMGGDVYAKGFLKTYALALGLDPEGLLTIYRRRVQGSSSELSGSLAQAPVAREPRGAPPAWFAWLVAGFIVLLGAVALANLVGGTAPDPADQPRPPAAVVPTAPASEATPTPTPTPTPTFDGVNVVLTFEGDSWIRVTADGEVIHESVTKAGETLEFRGDQAVVIRYGNAGGVRVTLNGRDLGLVGEPGRVVERAYGPDGELVEDGAA